LNRNDVPTMMSNPTALFFSRGQIVTLRHATSIAGSSAEKRRFRDPYSVAKYQPKRMSNNSPMKNVNAGLIPIADCCLLIADCRSWWSSANQRLHYSNTPSLRWFRDTRDGRFFHLDLHVIGNFYDHGGIFHIGNK